MNCKKRFLPSFFSNKLLIFKSLFYLLSQDNKGLFWHFFSKNSLSFLTRFFLHFFQREEKFSPTGYFFHGLRDLRSMKKAIHSDNSILFIGFSYCQRPLGCPSPRFSKECQRKTTHPICSGCLIGAFQEFSSPTVHVTIIPTVFYLAKKILQIREEHPSKQILFIISTCPFSLRFFAPWAKFLRLQGVSLSLSGSVCPNFDSFLAAEKGAKNSKTDLTKDQKDRLFELLTPSKSNPRAAKNLDLV
jgi:hypothetical protein